MDPELTIDSILDLLASTLVSTVQSPREEPAPWQLPQYSEKIGSTVANDMVAVFVVGCGEVAGVLGDGGVDVVEGATTGGVGFVADELGNGCDDETVGVVVGVKGALVVEDPLLELLSQPETNTLNSTSEIADARIIHLYSLILRKGFSASGRRSRNADGNNK